MAKFKTHTNFDGGDAESMSAPKTKFKGRGAMPPGELKHYPGAVGDISGSNRRAAKAAHGEGGGSPTTFKTHTGFGGSRKR